MSDLTSPELESELVSETLTRLHHPAPPAVTLDGLTGLYRAWCRSVPFDNAQARLWTGSVRGRDVVGWPPRQFLSDWLRDGMGGSCAPGTFAWHSLLLACGFRSGCAVAAINGRSANHFTTIVGIDDLDYVVDSTYQSEVPVPLCSRGPGIYGRDLHRVRVRPEGSSWLLSFAGPADGRDHHCLVLARNVTPALMVRLSRLPKRNAAEAKRAEKFVAVLFSRRNTESGHVMVVGSQVFRAQHTVGITLASVDDVSEVLQEMGYSEAVSRRLAGGHDGEDSERASLRMD